MIISAINSYPSQHSLAKYESNSAISENALTIRTPMKMFFIAIWVFLPALLVSFVWWSWQKEREKKGWRQTAILISASALSANVALTLGILGSIFTPDFVSVPVSVPLAGLALCIASIVATLVGTGRLRWLAIPTAILQGLFWLVALSVAGGSQF